MAKKLQLAAGLDLGSHWTRLAVVAPEDGLLHFRAYAETPSRGWQRGEIVSQDELADSVRRVLAEVERKLGEPVGIALMGVGGPRLRSQQGRGVYEFGHRRPIEQEDLAYAIELAARARLDEHRMLVQVLPQNFTVDGRPPIAHPLHLECERLEAHALLVTAAEEEHECVVNAAQSAQLLVRDTVFEATAAAYASILAEERSGGAVLVDIGAHSTNVLFYDGDAALFAIGLPLSGDHFTYDLGELKSLSFDEAEQLKLVHGCALLGLSADNIIIELPAQAGRPGREINRRDIVEILEARAKQLFEFIEACRVRFARGLVLHEGVVLCGGGARLEGMVELAEKVLGCPARLGLPRGIMGWPQELQTPQWTTAAGLAMYAARLNLRKDKGSGGPSIFGLFTGK